MLRRRLEQKDSGVKLLHDLDDQSSVFYVEALYGAALKQGAQIRINDEQMLIGKVDLTDVKTPCAVTVSRGLNGSSSVKHDKDTAIVFLNMVPLGLPDGALVPAYSGMRPKITGPGEPAADFMIQGPAQRGALGLWNLFGIESPGLTASLALAALLRERIDS